MAYATPEMKKKPEAEIEELSKEGMDLSKIVPRKTTLGTTQLSRTAVSENVVSNIILGSSVPEARKEMALIKALV
ncbi:MAG: hypothetical protein ABIG39_07090 [Candidatus Micrarchaeota archaeon]